MAGGPIVYCNVKTQNSARQVEIIVPSYSSLTAAERAVVGSGGEWPVRLCGTSGEIARATKTVRAHRGLRRRKHVDANTVDPSKSLDDARQYRKRIKVIDQTENTRRMRLHVCPVVVADGRTVGDIPLDEFTLDHAELVIAQPTLKDGSIRHVSQCLHRLFKLAVTPARILKQSPFPPGWLPLPEEPKDGEFLWPNEDATLLACKKVPLVYRIFYGFSTREGPRKGNVQMLRRDELHLDLPGGQGAIVLPKTKNGRGATCKLDWGTAEALRRWLRLHDSPWVFPAEMVPLYRRHREGKPVEARHLSAKLREHLELAGVKRPALYETTDNSMRMRLHDLRAYAGSWIIPSGATRSTGMTGAVWPGRTLDSA